MTREVSGPLRKLGLGEGGESQVGVRASKLSTPPWLNTELVANVKNVLQSDESDHFFVEASDW